MCRFKATDNNKLSNWDFDGYLFTKNTTYLVTHLGPSGSLAATAYCPTLPAPASHSTAYTTQHACNVQLANALQGGPCPHSGARTCIHAGTCTPPPHPRALSLSIVFLCFLRHRLGCAFASAKRTAGDAREFLRGARLLPTRDCYGCNETRAGG